MTVQIRTACVSDARSINEVFDHYIDHSVATFNEKHKTVAERENELQRLLKMYPFLIAEDEHGRLLGFACAEPFRAQSGYRFMPELTIYLHPDAPKGCGIGSRLFEELFRLLRTQGFACAISVVEGGNEASLALHRRFGFQEVGFLFHSAYKHGRWLDTRILLKTLCGFADPPREPIPFAQIQNQEVSLMLFLCYPKCSTCKKAQVFLDAHALPYTLRDIKQANPTAEELSQWQKKSGLPLKRFFNTSGMKYRELNLSSTLDNMSREEQLALLASDGMLMKRPLLVTQDAVLVGFREAQWQEALSVD